MGLCGSRRKLGLFVLFLVYFTGYFNIIAGVDVCSCQQLSCNTCASTGSCSKINVALNKTARASSLYDSTTYTEVSGPACLAVNGNTGTVFKPINTNPDNPACVHTADGDYTPYWEVDLGQQYIIYSITVYGRQENGRNMLRKATVSVDDKLCYTFPSDYFRPLEANISCNSPLTGRKVKIQKNNDIDLPFLAVCQVQVWVCKSGFYGTDCTNTCGNCSAGTCEPSSGVCQQGCVAGYQAPHCKDTCNNGSYGLNCSKTCGNCFEGNTCNPVSGECSQGCKSGYLGIYCNETCNNGSYGLNCSKSCGNCSEATTCNPESGECPQGCKPGYQGKNCNQTCNNGSYGRNCSKSCGNCSEKTTCNPVSGQCPQGCKPGYQLIDCNETCGNRTYGVGCNGTCGKCLEDTPCNIVTGHCETGCAAGSYPPLCNTVCTNHSYGTNCSNTCGNCLTGTACDPVSGNCSSGCVAGYHLPLCTERCSSKTYGENCAAKCGHCYGAVDCDIYNGTCQTCDENFLLPYCKDCIERYYGERCNETCGHCKNNVPCHSTTGDCPQGLCEDSWQGSKCGEEAVTGLGSDGNKPVIAGVVVGCGVPLIIVLVILSVLFLRRRRAQKSKQGSPTETRTNRQHSRYNAELSASASLSSSSKPAAEWRKKTGNKKPSIAVKPTVLKKPTGGAAGTQGVTSENVYVNVTSEASGDVQADDDISSADILPELEDESDHTYSNEKNTYATFMASRPQLDSVQQSLIALLGSGILAERFEELPKGLTDVHEAAKLPVNIKKNRYYSVLPYDKNRVVLSDGFSEGKATNYVNASYIAGFQHERAYIAAQGPRDNTAGDFWRMVWQEDITQVIMLTGLVENGKDKCFEYWPDRDKTETYGPVTVTGVDVQRKANFFIRSFVIKMRGSGEEREVEQLNFVTWPDHGVPTTTSLLNFWRFAKARAPQRPPPPVLVHCTAGVGRTGTYIGLDIAYEQAVTQGDVNLYKIVECMRKERCSMVQALDQYIFLHKAVLEAYTAKDTIIANDRFDKIFPQPVTARKENSRIGREFKRAMQMCSLTPAMPVTMATEEGNKTKIRNTTFLPADEHLVYLTAYVPGRGQFINAVYLSTYREYNGSILTQLPLEETLVDFWRLVDGCDVKTIVSIGHENEHETVQDFCQFWPKDAGMSLSADPYIIRHKVTSALGSHLTSYTLNLEKKKVPGSRQVQLLHYKAWAGELPENTTDLLALIDKIDSLCLGENNPPPVIIQCQDGVTRSGLFAALCNVFSRLTSDKEVDVYMAVREVHSVRPQAVTSLEQYRYCYEVAQKRVSELNIYSNA